MESRQNHLPVWTNRCYAYASQQEVLRMAAEPGFYSLLPVKFRDFGLRSGGVLTEERTEAVRTRGQPETQYTTLRLEPLLYRYAKKLYDTAAGRLLIQYPALEAVAAGPQRQTGAYELLWRYPVAEIEAAQRALMAEILKEGFTLEEELALSCTKRSGERFLSVNGALKLTPKSLRALMRRPPEELLQRPLKKAVAFSLADCEQYYQAFPEDRLELGNQFRAYAATEPRNADAFAAARSGDFELLCKLAKNGYDLNAIGRDGASVFGLFACGLLQQYRGGRLPRFALQKLDELIFLGANPALYGVSRHVISPLACAADCDLPDAVDYFLKKGVSPEIYPTIQPTGGGASLRDRIRARSGDPAYPNAEEIVRLLEAAE